MAPAAEKPRVTSSQRRSFQPGIGAAYAAQSVALGALESIASGAPVEILLREGTSAVSA